MIYASQVSVVMSVYNGAFGLRDSIQSVLFQESVELELIIVNDGSIDETPKILKEYSDKDKRIIVIHQNNQGLTKALIRGCKEAQRQYIARQDVGDRSFPGRLAAQLAILKKNPDAVMTACGTRFLDSEGNHLFDAVHFGDELDRALRATNEKQIRGPSHHGAVMFRRDAYEKAGGYRLPFYVAQDLDLWTRLVEHGVCMTIPEILYEATWSPGSISHLKRKQQIIATRAILACRTLRSQGKNEQPVLDRIAKRLNHSNQAATYPEGLPMSRYHYFAGSLLEKKNPSAAKRHFDLAVSAWPLNLKARLKRFRMRLNAGEAP
jgi:glycosyltransferase involved in cell wall biosynthesis